MNSFMILLLLCAFVGTMTGPIRVDENNNEENEGGEYSSDDEGVAEDDVLVDDGALANKAADAQAALRPEIMDYSGSTHLPHMQRIVQPKAVPNRSSHNNPGNKAYHAIDEKFNDGVDATKFEPQGPSERQTYMNNYVQDNAESKFHDTFESGFGKKIARLGSSSKDHDNSMFVNHPPLNEYMVKTEEVEFNGVIPINKHNKEDNSQVKNTYDIRIENENNRDNMNYPNAASFNVDRNRRQAQESQAASDNGNTNVNDGTNKLESEDEEMAIKRHIRHLSTDELEELLNSLSDDKKILLQKIMDSDNTRDDINKREIIKKSGAIEENALNENIQSDTNKVQTVSAESQSESSLTRNDLNDPKEVNSSDQSDNIESSSVQTVDLINSPVTVQRTSELEIPTVPSNANLNIESEQKTNAKLVELESKTLTKRENKMEVNNKKQEGENKMEEETDLTNSVDVPNTYSNFDGVKVSDMDYICPQNEEQSQLLNSEMDLNNDANVYKRDVNSRESPEKADVIKALEDSFPCSDSYDESGAYSGSDMVPLIRVKRKEVDSSKKRSVEVVEPKTSYFPYRSENDDEDTDEGNEFDDEGFYDRTSNFAKNLPQGNVADELIAEADEPNAEYTKGKPKLIRSANSDHSTKDGPSKSDTTNDRLGSDTDNILSGVEGVDENLMLSSDARSRRASENNLAAAEASEDEKGTELRVARSTPLMDNDELQQTYENDDVNSLVPTYHENDAFGGLPRNYEGELGRHKRIRRVKDLSSAEITT